MTNLTKEQQEFIINLSNEMKTQDTRFTAQPYGLVLQEKRIRPLPDQLAESYMAHDAKEAESYYDWEEFIEIQQERAEDGEIEFSFYQKLLEFNGFEELRRITHLCEYFNIDIYGCDEQDEISQGNFNLFLTEKGYKEHVRQNGHNLNQASYGIHFYRNPEIEQLFGVIHALAAELSEEKSKSANLDQQAEPQYYIRNKDARYLGNAPFWVALNDHGYTAYIQNAHVFSETEATKYVEANPDKFEMFACEKINRRLQLVFDKQDIKRLDEEDCSNNPWGENCNYAEARL